MIDLPLSQHGPSSVPAFVAAGLSEAGRGALAALAACAPHEVVSVFCRRGNLLQQVEAFGPRAALLTKEFALSEGTPWDAALRSGAPRLVRAGERLDALYLDGFVPSERLLVPLRAGAECSGMILIDTSAGAALQPAVVALAHALANVASFEVATEAPASGLSRITSVPRGSAPAVPSIHGVNAPGRASVEPTLALSTFESAPMRELLLRARQIARSDTPVLLVGESGVGKALLGRAIVEWSSRARAPYVEVECAEHSSEELEAVLFGQEPAFGVPGTAAALSLAHGGTLLLRSVECVPVALQGRLLDVLQQGTFRDGSSRPTRVELRLIATTHVELMGAVAQGHFRGDLYERIAVSPLRLPALRERGSDAALIAQRFLERRAENMRVGPWRLSTRAEQWLCSYAWPGNVAELLNVLERAMLLRPRGVIDTDVLPSHTSNAPRVEDSAELGGFPSFTDNERSYFERALTLTGGKLHGRDGAAALVGLKPTTLQSRLKKLGIQPKAWKRGKQELSAGTTQGGVALGTPGLARV